MTESDSIIVSSNLTRLVTDRAESKCFFFKYFARHPSGELVCFAPAILKMLKIEKDVSAIIVLPDFVCRFFDAVDPDFGKPKPEPKMDPFAL